MSNAERQRQFRERNPGYYTLANRQRRAAITRAKQLETLQFIESMSSKVARPTLPLALPAPVKSVVVDLREAPQLELANSRDALYRGYDDLRCVYRG